jgi:hypothetical protein
MFFSVFFLVFWVGWVSGFRVCGSLGAGWGPLGRWLDFGLVVSHRIGKICWFGAGLVARTPVDGVLRNVFRPEWAKLVFSVYVCLDFIRIDFFSIFNCRHLSFILYFQSSTVLLGCITRNHWVRMFEVMNLIEL